MVFFTQIAVHYVIKTMRWQVFTSDKLVRHPSQLCFLKGATLIALVILGAWWIWVPPKINMVLQEIIDEARLWCCLGDP